MAFKENNANDVLSILDKTILKQLGLTEEDLVELDNSIKGYTYSRDEEDTEEYCVETSEDGDCVEADEAETADPAANEVLGAKITNVLHNTLDQLLDGSLAFENAQELLTTIEAVRLVQSLEK